MATAWADSFDARQQIANYLNTAVATTLQATRVGEESRQGGTDAEAAGQRTSGSVDDDIKNALSAISIAQYTGAQKEADYWVLTRTHNSDGTTIDEYRALVLYLIDKSKLDTQAESMMGDIMKNNPALVNLATAAQAQISQNGLEWGAPESR
jgi:hypothetical protein